MYNRPARLAVLVGLAVVVSLSLPVAAPDVEPAAPAEQAKGDAVEECEGVVIAQVLPPIGSFPGCLGDEPLTCADIPMPVGSTCSCSSVLLDLKCRSCDPEFKGHVVQTTCTVHTPCTNPPCDINQNFTRTAYSCAQ